MSDQSDEVCERIVKIGLHTDTVKNLSWDSLSVDTLTESSIKRNFVEAVLGALHNVVRRAKSARSTFRQCKAVDVIQKFRGLTEYPVSFCFLILSATIYYGTKDPNFARNKIYSREGAHSVSPFRILT